MTAETSSRLAASRVPTLASSTAFGTFAIVFAIATSVLYVASELGGAPLFTYHPGTNRVDFGWVPPRAGEGPAMYWYGWVATTLIGSTALGFLATLLPQSVARKIPLFLIWLAPLPVLAMLAYTLMPFWTK
jgi:hypothetical protein